MRKTLFKKARCVVIKIGTSVLSKNGIFNSRKIQSIVNNVAYLKETHPRTKFIIVSSGAISSGMMQFGIRKRPQELAGLQALASMGQAHLVETYNKAFKKHGIQSSQILLTRDDLSSRKRFMNIRKTIERLFHMNVIPVINENDSVATEELEFGDNDQLSTMIASMIQADVLILLSDSNGFYSDLEMGEKSRLSMVDNLSHDIFKSVKDKKTSHTKGGMFSKLQAIDKANHKGLPCFLISGLQPNALKKLFEGQDVGTLFMPKVKRMNSKEHWIEFISKTEGDLYIDDGAVEAVLSQNRSLLSKGIHKFKGHFEAGSVVDIYSDKKKRIGKGIINFSSTDLSKILGLKTDEWEEALGKPCLDEVIHRDNIVKTLRVSEGGGR